MKIILGISKEHYSSCKMYNEIVTIKFQNVFNFEKKFTFSFSLKTIIYDFKLR